jgi:hypothetical protein
VKTSNFAPPTLALLALLCGGCTAFRNPLVAETGPAFDSRLVGHWIASTDEGTVELDVRAEGAEGVVIARSTKAGEPPEVEELRLITAKLGRAMYASVKRRTEPDRSWTLLAYEVAANRLRIRDDNQRFWNDAVRDHQVSGTLEKGDWSQTATVTASEQELRVVVSRNARAAFEAKPVLEFRRATPRR